MAIKIDDVAKAAGVSKATVSRVINNSPLITPDTSEKVRRVMRELEYIPSRIARGFSNKSTYNIALIIDVNNADAFVNPYFYQIQYGIEKVICNLDYNLIIANEKTAKNKETALSRIILEKRADGIIFPAFLLKKSIVRKMEEENIPFVVLGEPNPGFNVNWVDINNKMAGNIAAAHVVENGYKRIAFLAGNFNDKFNINRYNGYKEILKSNNMKFDELFMKDVNTKNDGYTAAQKLMDMENPPDAMIFTSNISAFGAIQALKAKGISIPAEVGVVSFDSYGFAELSDPMITTVDINVQELGVQAAMMLYKEIEISSSSKQTSLLSVNIIKRGSAER